MTPLDTTPTLYTTAQAAAAVTALSADTDDEWTYRVDLDPLGTGYARVAAYDESGAFVAYL